MVIEMNHGGISSRKWIPLTIDQELVLEMQEEIPWRLIGNQRCMRRKRSSGTLRRNTDNEPTQRGISKSHWPDLRRSIMAMNWKR